MQRLTVMMERIPLPFTWMQLRSVGNSPIVKASVLFPIIGYLILFNTEVSNFLNSTGLEKSPYSNVAASVWAHKLHFIYFGLMCLGIGSMIYSAFCPFIIKKHGDFADYVRIDGPSLSDQTVFEYADHLGLLGFFLSDDQVVADKKPDVLHQWYAAHSSQNKFARYLVSLLFLFGLALLSVPSALSSLKIASSIF